MLEAGPNDAQERLFPNANEGDGLDQTNQSPETQPDAAPEANPETPDANPEMYDEDENSQIAYGLTVYVTTEGQHGMSPIGDLALLDTIGLLYRALVGAQSQMYAQTALNMSFTAAKEMAQLSAKNKSNIIVPQMAPPPDVDGGLM